MPKRSVTEIVTQTTQPSQSFAKVSTGAPKRENVPADEMGEFEDAWEDEIESDEDVVDSSEEKKEDDMDVDEVLPAVEESEEQPVPPSVFIPGRHVLEKDEILEPDDSVYIMRHCLDVDCSCLTFDVLRDNLGDERQRYPATMYLVSGSQAESMKNNTLSVYKLSSLYRTQKGNDSEEEDEDDDDEDNLDEDPVIESKSIPHLGGVNRIRTQPMPLSQPLPPASQPYHVASWAETGKVHIFDVRPLIESLDVPGYTYDKARVQQPVFTIDSHGKAEGFAMDWASSDSSLRLVTGDIHSKIYLTTSTSSGFAASSQPFISHTSSVEDLQWSPTEQTIFASCSADCSIRIWDVRVKGRKSVTGIDNAHGSDVNVISWNGSTAYLLLSGGDDGALNVWDLRSVKSARTAQPSTPVASFNWHKQQITSVEWHPTDDSVFVASGADDQVTIWDLAVEQDEDETGTMLEDHPVPPQLLFVHQGQRDIKEVHWHPQIPGTVISTALDGFNIFKTISV